MHFEIF